MRKLVAQWAFCAIAAILFCIESQIAQAQEAVSTTSSSGTATSSSASATNSSASTTSSSATTTTSSSEAPAVSGQPSGAGVFSRSPVQLMATISGGYDDNVNGGVGREQASSFTNGNVILSYDFGNPRLQLTLNAGAGGTYYYERLSSQNYDLDLKAAWAVTYKATPRLTLGLTAIAAYLTEPSFDYAGGLNQRNGNYFYTTDRFFVAYEWTRRFSTKTTYTLDVLNYDNASVGVFANHVENIFGNEFRFLAVPTTSLIGEYRFGIVTYEHSLRDSTTHFVLAGLDHTFNPRLSATVRGGAEFRSYEADGDRTGPYFEGNVSYALGKRTSISWTNRYGIEEPDVPDAQSRTTFRTGLQAKLDLTSRISSSLTAYYEHSAYHGSVSSSVPSMPFVEDSVNLSLALRYAITRYFGIEARYNHTEVTSDMTLRDYSRNRFVGGLNVTF